MKDKNEKLLYQTNKVSYNLLMLCVALNTYYLITTLNNINIGFSIGVIIVGNIAYTLLAFLCAVKVKTYDELWSKICIFMGFTQFFKLITLPSEIVGTAQVGLFAALLISGASYIVAAIISLNKIKLRSTLDHKNVDSLAG